MSRAIKKGLDYFPLDIDIDQSDEMLLLTAKYPEKGFEIIIKLLARVYKEGYFYKWTDQSLALFSHKIINTDLEYIKNCIEESILCNFFDKKIYNKYKILTSKGIQKRYFEAIKRRKKVIIFEEIVLIDINVHINEDNVYIKSLNVDISTQSKVKESKVKKSTDNKSRPKDFKEVEIYAKSIDFEIDGEYFIDYYKTRDWELKKGQKIKDWKACVRTWKSNAKKYNINPAMPTSKQEKSSEQIKINERKREHESKLKKEQAEINKIDAGISELSKKDLKTLTNNAIGTIRESGLIENKIIIQQKMREIYLTITDMKGKM